MLLAGDEIGRTQGGNNNAYCQDNEVSWVNWEGGEADLELSRFVHELTSVVSSNPVLHRRGFFTGKPVNGGVIKDVTWIRPDGAEMQAADWEDPENRTIGMLLPGRAADEVDSRGRSARGDTVLLLLNAGAASKAYTLPKLDEPGRWEEILNTARPGAPIRLVRGNTVNLTALSTMVLRHGRRQGG